MRKPVGYVKKRKRDGKVRWVARITYTEKDTGRAVDRLRVANTKTEADRLLDELRDEFRKRGRIEIDKRLATFESLCEVYKEKRVFPAEFHQGRKTAGLKSHYQANLYLDILKAHFGKKRVKDIRHSDLVSFRRRRLKTPTRGEGERSIAAVNRELELLRAVLRFAVREGYLEKSPFEQGESLIVKQHEERRERVMSFDEEQKLLDACVDRYAHLRPLIIVAVDTGMRRGELFKMRWEDVDFERGFITILPENEKANRGRSVAMTSRVSEELLRLRTSRKDHLEGLVFRITTSIKHGWAGICKDAGIKDLRFHDLRHTCVTRLIESGVAPAAVLKAAGHSTLSMLARYLNPGDESLTMAAAALDQLRTERESKKKPALVN